MSEMHFSARLELEQAALYYSEISLDLAEKFLQDYERTLSFIEAMPYAWPSHYLKLKKLNFNIFPYSIIYDVLKGTNGIIIIAIQHHSKEPFYWIDRM